MLDEKKSVFRLNLFFSKSIDLKMKCFLRKLFLHFYTGLALRLKGVNTVWI